LRRHVRGRGWVEPAIIKRQSAAAAAVAPDALHAAKGPRDDGKEDEAEELEGHAYSSSDGAGQHGILDDVGRKTVLVQLTCGLRTQASRNEDEDGDYGKGRPAQRLRDRKARRRAAGCVRRGASFLEPTKAVRSKAGHENARKEQAEGHSVADSAKGEASLGVLEGSSVGIASVDVIERAIEGANFSCGVATEGKTLVVVKCCQSI
jgi:hypothetical protein